MTSRSGLTRKGYINLAGIIREWPLASRKRAAIELAIFFRHADPHFDPERWFSACHRIGEARWKEIEAIIRGVDKSLS